MKANSSSPLTRKQFKESEKGVALAVVIIILALIMAISVGVLAVVNTETGIMSSDVRRTEAFYASASSIEFVTNNFSQIFTRKIRPTAADLLAVSNNKPQGLEAQGFVITQSIVEDAERLAEMRANDPAIRDRNSTKAPIATIVGGSLEGLYATITPYKVQATAEAVAGHTVSGTKVTTQREINSYQVPLFQFGIFGNNDVELHPGPRFMFNGRIHSNRNVYLGGGELILEDKVTSANEIVYGLDRNGATRNSNVQVKVGSDLISLTTGSVNTSTGPHFNSAGVVGDRGFFPDSPTGTVNNGWDAISILTPSGNAPNRFSRQVLTRSTNATELLLPLQLDGATPREIIERPMPGESENLRNSRYHNKAKIRILLDSEDAQNGVNNVAGIGNNANGTQKGVALSTFQPIALPISGSNGNRNALLPISSTGIYDANSALCQIPGPLPVLNCTPPLQLATIVREIRDYGVNPLPAGRANGAGITGRIAIELVRYNEDGTEAVTDVTTPILSMGMTVGEPNAIVHLQRPLWAAFVPGSRTRLLGSNLVDLVNQPNTTLVNDGELNIGIALPGSLPPEIDPTLGFIKNIVDDGTLLSARDRMNKPKDLEIYNHIVPINVYNVREGWSAGWTSNDANTVTERGMTSVVELNMRNLARWLDGYYDANLLANTAAVSANINPEEGFVVYVSDRRGDRVKREYALYDKNGAPVGASVMTTNGIVDNEDVYNANFASASLDNGEDVISFGVDPDNGNQPYRGTLQNEKQELPLPTLSRIDGAEFPFTQSGNLTKRIPDATNIFRWKNNANANGRGFFRRAVRLFNAEDIDPGFSAARLSEENGITIAAENMVYIWGNYNTTGIKEIPKIPLTNIETSTKNDGGYIGDQVPASIICDAFFPISRTWYDGLSVIFPNGDNRFADADLPIANDIIALRGETSVRTAIIAGTTMSALTGEPDQFAGTGGESRLSGGVHNFPRFLERWGDNRRWNYTGSLILLYYSNQAMGSYNSNGVIYQPPKRNWSFDITFRDPKRLPPGTPLFQFVQPTGFRQVINPNPS